MGTTQRKERERHQMEKLILDAAMKLFLEHGFENVSMRKIAEEIEYSPTAIYLYFKDKIEILYRLQNMGFQKFYELQMSVQNIEDLLERLKAHGRAYIKFAVENPEYYDLMFIMKEPLEGLKDPKDWREGNISYDLLRQNVRSCIEAGIIKYPDVESVSFAAWSFVHGIAVLLNKRGMMIPEQWKQQLVDGAFDFLFSRFK